MIPSGIQLKKSKIIDESSTKCIICQSNEEIACISHETGRLRIKEAAELKRDVVLERLQKFGSNFVYHSTNSCYKAYTHKKQTTQVESVNPSVCTNTRILPISLSSNESKKSPREERCVVCDCITYKGKFEKSRITDPNRAQKFLDAKAYFKDVVDLRTSSVYNVDDIIKNSLLCHKECIRNYIRRYEEMNGKQIVDASTSSTQKETNVNDYLKTLEPKLKEGKGFTLSEIRNKIQETHSIGVDNRYGSHVL